MKKKLFAIVIVVTVIAFATIATVMATRSKERKMTGVAKTEITKIIITNGSNGDIAELKSGDIGSLYDLLANTSVKMTSDEESSGWEYSLDIVAGDKTEKILIVSDSVCVIGNDRYLSDKNDGAKIISEIEKNM